MNCASSFGKALSFMEEEFECPVCLQNHSVGIRHPSGCNHVFCVGCTERLFWGDRTEIDPRDYGFTGDGDNSLDEWTETDEAGDYNQALDEQEQIDDQFRPDERCPLCRREAIPDWQANVGEWVQ